MLSPERAMEIQALLGSDIQMVLDECPAFPATEAQIEKSLMLSMRWAKRSKDGFRRAAGTGVFGIVQGGVYPPCAAVGGGAAGNRLRRLCGWRAGGGRKRRRRCSRRWSGDAAHATDRPRYLMGVGKPDDIVGAVLRGVDMFDCVLPTRSGRNGQAFTWSGPLNLRNARFAEDPRRWMPIAAARPAGIQPRLSASCGQSRRNHRLHAADLAQSDNFTRT